MRRSSASTRNFPISASSTRSTMSPASASSPATRRICSARSARKTSRASSARTRARSPSSSATRPTTPTSRTRTTTTRTATYPRIDERIKDDLHRREHGAEDQGCTTCTRASSAGRRDRLKDDGIMAFISNRSFIDSRTMDGFRKHRGARIRRDLGRRSRRRRARQPEIVGHEVQRLRHPDRRRDQLSGQAQGGDGLSDFLCAAAGDGDEGGQAGVSRRVAAVGNWLLDEVRPDANANWINHDGQ